MHLGDVFDDGQPQASAAVFTTAGFIDAIKALKDPREMFRWDANTLITDGDAQGFPCLARREPDSTASVTVGNSILE
jgi:hypothetical protein